MVAQREVLEKTRRDALKRRWRIWLICLGVVSLLIAFLVILLFTDIIFRISENTQSAPQSGEWSMFRRDLSHTGNAGTDGTLPEGTLKWTFTTGGPVRSSPAVVDGTVYFGSVDGNIYALDAVTGEQRWAYKTGSWVVSSPIVVDGVVYCGSNDGNLYALNATTGEKLWSFSMIYAIQSSPAIADGVVYIGSTNYYLYAVDAATGQELWRKRTDGMILASPIVTEGVVAVGSMDGRFYSFNAKNGKPRLKYVTNFGIKTSAAVKDGVAYFIGKEGYFSALDVSEKNWLWEIKIRSYWSVFYIYGVAPKPPKPSGYLWEISLGFGVSSSSSPAMAGNYAYFGAGNDVISLDITTHQVQWTFHTGDLITSSPAIAGTVIYVGGQDGYLYAIDRTTGEKLWDIAAGDKITSSPALAGGMVYIGSEDGKLYAFK